MTAIGGYYSSGAYPWWFALREGSKMSKGGAELVGHGVSKRGETRHEHGRENEKGARGECTGDSRNGGIGEWEGTGEWRRASIHIHPGVATGTLITCFNLPTADWASICHSKSVIARGATPSARYHHRRLLPPLCIAITSLLVV